MKLANKIKHLLVDYGNISEAELARRLGVTPQSFNKKIHKTRQRG